jgi:hypothetical protein
MKSEGSLPYSQELVTGPHPEPDEYSPITPHPISLCISPHLQLFMFWLIFIPLEATPVLCFLKYFISNINMEEGETIEERATLVVLILESWNNIL